MADHTPDTRSVDVLIVGAGLSGIGMAYRLQERLPHLSYALVEARDAIGGTWDLFRYPGVRSDSDIFTLAFPFRPWSGDDSIVQGDDIRDYLEDTARESGILAHTRFSTRVVAADWSSEDARWRVRVATGPDSHEETYEARFVSFCSGYYDYEQPYDPGFAGVDDFEGTLVHPQFWPDDLDYAGKKVVVIGSGATAITIVPAMAQDAGHVTMLQRTPTYVLAQPKQDVIGNAIRKVLPARSGHLTVRAKNTALQWGLYQACRRLPDQMASLFRKGAVAAVGSEEIVDAHFTPPYAPWDQRLCISPGGDLFEVVREGTASVVTAHIDRFVENGVRLTDGRVVEADIVVTATGLSLKLLGGAALSVDGAPVDLSQRYAYRATMLSGVPNLSFCIGYINLSWTMRSDMTARLVSRIIERLDRSGDDTVTPVMDGTPASRPLFDMDSGYIRRGEHLQPRAVASYPWAMKQNVVVDAWHTNHAGLDDGLAWTSSRTRRPSSRAAAGE
ncbi:NAD(P)/FAD-dependent oxidoreductase [Mumia sp. ZJ1417]|uniref:flavin-containing monooxygenase n=1 Tax=Mumia sp. ZJ1417 TaxID=2708082 RepID=UPI001424831E|nr:NAD(P)/FAD-dependent oxidoreductase [Mumia sp. ZJ1417]QMW67240.1 NAD(P)/FAD-dependent oxidoreductase [Mumia sp. ZJ1417]